MNLKIKKMSTETYETKKEGIKEIYKVVLYNPSDGITITLKGKKASHPLRNWDRRMLSSKEPIHMTLSVPTIKQKSITDKFNGEEEQEEGE